MRGGPAASGVAAAKLSASSLKVQSRKRVTVKLACPKDVATCAGKLTLKRGKVTLGSAKYSVAAGKSKQRAREPAVEGPRADAQVQAGPRAGHGGAGTGGSATTKTVTLRR